ncbi:hypothetical protein C5B90_06425 [Haloferax sp. Atlit-12N]|uniref:hypothetical protein n=1 Tax=Haloferax sp. Atlit-12N TaxID=2077203 RepID=UPI000E2706D8|nr:hypothetical protein [Haloferax sp. Atlit-12N]RDZ65979.1 hypothetical protein C5B90_06425 [Haloferax sp. Atlit-12N]
MIRHTQSMLVVCLLVATIVIPGIVVAQESNNSTDINETAPYYANNSSNVSVDTWLEGRSDPTLDNITNIATRIGPFVIGGGSTSIGSAQAGALVTGLMVLAVFLGAVMGSGVGSAGGATIAVAIAAAIVQVGLAPQWMWAIVVLGVGIVMATVSIRAFR